MNAEQTNNDVKIEQLEPQPVLSIRATVRIEQLGEVMGDRIQALRDYLQQHGAQPAGPPFVRYHTFGETETDLETGVPVTSPIGGEGRIAGGELPGGPVITSWHTGPHDKLGDAYARIETWLREQGRERDGAAWEVYYWIDLSHDLDPSSWDPSTWGTQLVQPIKQP
ncbi:MAG TPA: GyrI-like domain-containing protein [Chloroflexia bacterium]|nr:GyrI-like domain-containing protein [Chloroflexia bacterium]